MSRARLVLGWSLVLWVLLMLWALLYGVGLVSEGRAHARSAEISRLVLVTPLGMVCLVALGTVGPDAAIPAWLGLALYAVMSLVLLGRAMRPEMSAIEAS